MTDYGIKISEGKDVDAANDNELLYSSLFQSPKIKVILKDSFTTDGSGNGSVTFQHLLGYSPAVFSYVQIPSGNWISGNGSYGGGGLVTRVGISDVKVTGRSLTPATTYKVQLFLLTDPATEDDNV